MSEWEITGYLMKNKDDLRNVFGSKDDKLLRKILKEAKDFIKENEDRFPGKTLEEAIEDIINGREEKGFAFQYGFATMAICEAICDNSGGQVLLYRPENLSPVLKKLNLNIIHDKWATQLTSEYMANHLPIPLSDWEHLPSACYFTFDDIKSAKIELDKIEDFEDEVEKLFDNEFDNEIDIDLFDEIDNTEHVTDTLDSFEIFISESFNQQKELIIFLDGDS